MNATPSLPPSRQTVRLRDWRIALPVFVLVAAISWWWSTDASPNAALAPALSVSSDATTKPAARASIVVTLRWGVTDHHNGQSEIAGYDGVNWDGYLALDCGRIESVSPLAFELDDPVATSTRPTDFLGDVVRGAGGDERIYWRSRTQAGWDGVRVKLQACDPDRAHSGSARPSSTLTVRTAQRSYTARLDWSANDFVALATERRGQNLEVYINAEHDLRTLRGARITALTSQAAAELARVSTDR